jgi:hypothetical protein
MRLTSIVIGRTISKPRRLARLDCKADTLGIATCSVKSEPPSLAAVGMIIIGEGSGETNNVVDEALMQALEVGAH